MKIAHPKGKMHEFTTKSRENRGVEGGHVEPEGRTVYIKQRGGRLGLMGQITGPLNLTGHPPTYRLPRYTVSWGVAF
jgi:hypothetical protein